MENEIVEEQTTKEKVKEQIENEISNIVDNNCIREEIDYLYKLVDIHKDFANEEYWQTRKDDNMRYSEYGNYNGYQDGSYGRRGVPGSGRRYRAGGNYGTRGVDAKYRGEEIMDDMYQTYQEYADGKEMYGADGNTIKALEYMLKLDKKFIKMLEQEAQSPEEKELIREHKMEMAEM